jgi:hypothetical protein
LIVLLKSVVTRSFRSLIYVSKLQFILNAVDEAGPTGYLKYCSMLRRLLVVIFLCLGSVLHFDPSLVKKGRVSGHPEEYKVREPVAGISAKAGRSCVDEECYHNGRDRGTEDEGGTTGCAGLDQGQSPKGVTGQVDS